MDPRHPELALSRMDELLAQYKRIESDIKMATTSGQLATLENEGSLVVQEICLVAPRLHESMAQASRIRRGEMAKGNIYSNTERYTPPNQAEVEIAVLPKTRKTKKRKAKK